MRGIPKNEATRNEGLLDLLTVIVLSRFIHPTSTGERYCANVLRFGQPNLPILALQLAGNPDVFLGDNSRDWLAPKDGLALLELMPWVSPSKRMYPRIHRAYWNHEQAMRTYFLDMRWNLVVSGLEALITTHDHRVRQQFVRRVGHLASEFGVALSETELHNAYTLRSKLAHAQSFLYDLHAALPPDEHSPLYDKLESLLRATVKKCLLDEGLAERFANKEAVAEWCP